MAGRRVFVSGVGGELGTLVAQMLENEPWVGSIAGIDVDPPRRRLQRTAFHRVSPGDHDRIVDTITGFKPHVLVHISVWEPSSRASPSRAAALTEQAAVSVIGAAAECTSLENIVVRSGIEIYGRGPGSLTRPDECAAVRPTSGYGRSVADLEQRATSAAERIGATVGALRLATVLGPHVPSPLGRVLRQPVVPFNAVSDPPFAVIAHRDAARAFVAAARHQLSQPVNVAAPGAITCLHAIRRGQRIPLPLIGPQWAIARRVSYLTGAPIPDHVAETLTRGRLADNSRMRELLDLTPEFTTTEVIDRVFAWPKVIRRPARVAAAAQIPVTDPVEAPDRQPKKSVSA